MMLLTRMVSLSFLATYCSVAFSLAQAQTVSLTAPLRFQDGLRAAQTGDALQALWHFQVLAAQGHEAAQYNLGLMYLNGFGVPVDMGQAKYWFLQSAAQGSRQAEAALQGISRTDSFK
jgi:TPR repeat protein